MMPSMMLRRLKQPDFLEDADERSPRLGVMGPVVDLCRNHAANRRRHQHDGHSEEQEPSKCQHPDESEGGAVPVQERTPEKRERLPMVQPRWFQQPSAYYGRALRPEAILPQMEGPAEKISNEPTKQCFPYDRGDHATRWIVRWASSGLP